MLVRTEGLKKKSVKVASLKKIEGKGAVALELSFQNKQRHKLVYKSRHSLANWSFANTLPISFQSETL